MSLSRIRRNDVQYIDMRISLSLVVTTQVMIETRREGKKERRRKKGGGDYLLPFQGHLSICLLVLPCPGRFFRLGQVDEALKRLSTSFRKRNKVTFAFAFDLDNVDEEAESSSKNRQVSLDACS